MSWTKPRRTFREFCWRSKSNPLNLLQRDVVSRSVVEFRGARRFVRRNVSGRFKGTAVPQVHGDPSGTEAVIADAAFEASTFRTSLDDAERIDPGHAEFGDLAGASTGGPEERSFGGVLKAGRLDVRVQVFLGFMMARDLVKFPALSWSRSQARLPCG